MATPIKKTRKPKTAPKFKRPYQSPVNGKVVNMTDSQAQFTAAALQLRDSDTLITRVQEIYETDRQTARVITRQNFNKPNIIEYLGDRGYKAVDVLTEAMQADSATWSERITAAKDIADRQFGKAVQRSNNINQNFTREISDTNAIYDL